MSDFDLGYFYYLHDKNEESRELEESGQVFFRTAITLSVISILLWLLFRKSELLILLSVAIGLFILAKSRQAKMENIGSRSIPDRPLLVELHKGDLHNRFSGEISSNHSEKDKIARIILANSGSDINQVYLIYTKSGGTFEAEHFVRVVHGLKKHGLRVTKTVSL
ncbi:hypothetical protein HYU11_01465 [Candidatus Woesearchaeota archaeon]|nr:hypothetical protein [Candidatus Woesearchaeota archaeon]